MNAIINSQHPAVSWFLVFSGLFFLLVFALPLLFVPLTWATWFRWPLPEPGDKRHQGLMNLATYFGRCTGGLALVILVFIFRAVPDPVGHLSIFEWMAGVAWVLTFTHAWGAIRRTQPWTEDAEILLYGGTAVIVTWLRCTLT